MILLYNWLSKYTTYIMEACPTIWQRIMYSGILSSVFIRKALFHSCWYDHLWGEEDVIFQNGFANFLRVFSSLACVQQGKLYTQHVCLTRVFSQIKSIAHTHLVCMCVCMGMCLSFNISNFLYKLLLWFGRRVIHKFNVLLKVPSSTIIWW